MPIRISMRLSGGTSALRCAIPRCVDRAAGGVHSTAEFNQYSVAGTLDDAAAVFSDRRLKQFPAVRVEPSKCTFFVHTHEQTVAGNICRENGSKPPLHAV